MHTAMQSEQLWELPSGELVLPDGDVHVWRAALDLPASTLRCLHRALAPDELDRAGRIHDLARRERFIATHGLLRSILGRYLDAEPGQLRFCYGPYGKPALAVVSGSGALRFNLAHSHGLALCAVARGRELGVDLERIRSASGWEQMAMQCLAAGERATLGALPATKRSAAFFSYWVCKEAYLKAIGAGLSRPLGQVAIALRRDGTATIRGGAGMHWSIKRLPLDRDYVAALVVEGHGWRLRRWQWPAHIYSLIKRKEA